MSKPFGSMPEDAELAAYGAAFGVFFLGAATPNLVAAFVGARVTGGSSHLTWWIQAPMTAYALAVAVEAGLLPDPILPPSKRLHPSSGRELDST